MKRVRQVVKSSDNNILVCKNVSADKSGIGFHGRKAKFGEIIEFKESELELDMVKQFFAHGKLRILYRNFEPTTQDMKTYLSSPEAAVNKIELMDNVWEIFIS